MHGTLRFKRGGIARCDAGQAGRAVLILRLLVEVLFQRRRAFRTPQLLQNPRSEGDFCTTRLSLAAVFFTN